MSKIRIKCIRDSEGNILGVISRTVNVVRKCTAPEENIVSRSVGPKCAETEEKPKIKRKIGFNI